MVAAPVAPLPLAALCVPSVPFPRPVSRRRCCPHPVQIVLLLSAEQQPQYHNELLLSYCKDGSAPLRAIEDDGYILQVGKPFRAPPPPVPFPAHASSLPHHFHRSLLDVSFGMNTERPPQ
eukprot:298860-Chlamydomonas_euryale.AAC.1